MKQSLQLLSTLIFAVSLHSYTYAGDTTQQPLDCTLAGEHSTHDHTSHFGHGTTPIGVMGSHLHAKGEFMLSYRYMFMNMDSNYNGRDKVSTNEVLNTFMVAPDDMQMQMHMMGAMYAPANWLTLMGMVNFVQMEMNHDRRPMIPGTDQFKTKSEGIGDSSIGALFSIRKTSHYSLHGGLMIQLPTARTNESDEIPNMMEMPVRQTLPYPMQLGSGSWGIKPSLTYFGGNDRFHWGAQLNSTLYLSKNSNEYKLGDTYSATTWLSYKFSEKISTSFRIKAKQWDNIEGTHDTLNNLPVQTAQTSLQGGRELNAYLGCNYMLGSVRLSAEIGKTIWVDLEGPQLANDWSATLGIQHSW